MDAQSLGYTVAGSFVQLRRTARKHVVLPAGVLRTAGASGSSRERSDELPAVLDEGDREAGRALAAGVGELRPVLEDRWGHELLLSAAIRVRLRSPSARDEVARLAASCGCTPGAGRGVSWTLLAGDPRPETVLALCQALAGQPGIEFAEPDALTRHRFLDRDPELGWHLDNDGEGGGEAGADIGVRRAWELTRGSADIRVVIHDDGVDLDHDDLVRNLEPGRCFAGGSAPVSDGRSCHGTACAGLVAASRNGFGVVGVAPGCRLLPLRLNAWAPFTRFAASFDWAARAGHVISCSWSCAPSNEIALAIRRAVGEARGGRGVPCLFAVGNEGRPKVRFPSSLADALAVGSSDHRDARCRYSNFGNGLDLLAPGHGGNRRIAATDLSGNLGVNREYPPDGDYLRATDLTGFGSTSASTAIASGVAALVLSVRPDLSARDVYELMCRTADRIEPRVARYDDSGWSRTHGYGRLNAGFAVALARSRRPLGSG